jgi:hypothetical protein
MSTGEGLYGQVDSLMSLQIVISVERLRTLITLEWPIILLLLLTWVAQVHMLSHVLLRIAWHVHSANHLHLVAWVMYIGHDRSTHGW